MLLSVLQTTLIVVYYLLEIYLDFMILMIILSWFPGIQDKTWYIKLNNIADFYMGRFKGWLVIGFLDFTPIIGITIYEFALWGLRALIGIL